MRPSPQSKASKLQANYSINNQIRASQLRILDEEGEMLGIMSLKEALDSSQSAEKDLVLVAANAVPPVAKIINFNKFLYQESKKNAKSTHSQKAAIKDVQLSFMISPFDEERVLQKALSFVKTGHQVRVRMKLHGRQLGKKDYALDNLKNFLQRASSEATATEPKIQGKTIISILSKIKKT